MQGRETHFLVCVCYGRARFNCIHAAAANRGWILLFFSLWDVCHVARLQKAKQATFTLSTMLSSHERPEWHIFQDVIAQKITQLSSSLTWKSEINFHLVIEREGSDHLEISNAQIKFLFTPPESWMKKWGAAIDTAGPRIIFARGLVNFVPAVAHYFCRSLLADPSMQ